MFSNTLGAKKIKIELFDEGDKCNFYSIKIKGQKLLETEKFIEMYDAVDTEDDFNILVDALDRIQEKGALERYFKPESKSWNRIYAIPIGNTKLRLYLIRISEDIIILAGGGMKNKRTYQEVPELDEQVKLLENIEKRLLNLEKSKDVSYLDKNIYGINSWINI